MGCLKLILLLLLAVVTSLPPLLPELAIPERSDPSLEEAIASAKTQGFQANNLFAYLTEDCSLPCWNNIMLGKSSEKIFLEQVDDLKFNLGTFSDSRENEYDKQWRMSNNVTVQVEQEWFRFGFSLFGTFNDEIIQLLQLIWKDYGLLEMSPQVVYNNLGIPSDIYVSYSMTSGIVLWLEYEHLHTDFIYQSYAITDVPPFEICTDVTKWLGTVSATLIAFISSPEFPEQRLLQIENFIPSQLYKIYNIAEVSSYTAEGFAKDVVNNSETCLTLDEEFVSGIEE
jgi:hypothetical protein